MAAPTTAPPDPRSSGFHRQLFVRSADLYYKASGRFQMALAGPRVAPDGVLIDHVAEFVYEPTTRLQTLFERDPEGYVHAVAVIVQRLAIGGTIVGTRQPGAIEPTVRLKSALEEAGRLDFAESFFAEEQRTQRIESATTWLTSNWDAICGELEDSTSEVSVALLGNLRREFRYYWLHEDPHFSSALRYRAAYQPRSLPQVVLQRLLREISQLAAEYEIDQGPQAFSDWIEERVTTHYGSFAEYWLHLGSVTGDDYEPALTRSSLRFIERAPGTSVQAIVMPFVAIRALQNVSMRVDLLPRVIDWTQGPGREIVGRLSELQAIVRSERDRDRQRQLLTEVERALLSPLPRGLHIALSLLRLDSGAERLALSRSYRWLWSLRDQNVKAHWRRMVHELVQSAN